MAYYMFLLVQLWWRRRERAMPARWDAVLPTPCRTTPRRASSSSRPEQPMPKVRAGEFLHELFKGTIFDVRSGGGGGGTCCDGSSGTVGKKWSKRSRSRFEKEKKHPSIVIIKPVFRIWVNWIRIQPKISIWIGIQKTSNPDLYPSYRYFLTLSGKKFNYFIIIRFSHQKKSMER